uniref:Transporter n=1 Tax=Heterorhabditis bacteriophora TaxID=37862 RepID=A0A1I7WM22_HETBA
MLSTILLPPVKMDSCRKYSTSQKQGDHSTSQSSTTTENIEEIGPVSNRGYWDNQIQFILSCLGLAVGLGNIWRFPAMAYENGGSAFLLPYITCALLFGLPMTYLEFIIGQYTNSGPSMTFRNYFPAFQGIGWAMTLISTTLSVYYTVIIAWSGVYMASIYTGNIETWGRCDNAWNSDSEQVAYTYLSHY